MRARAKSGASVKVKNGQVPGRRSQTGGSISISRSAGALSQSTAPATLSEGHAHRLDQTCELQLSVAFVQQDRSWVGACTGSAGIHWEHHTSPTPSSPASPPSGSSFEGRLSVPDRPGARLPRCRSCAQGEAGFLRPRGRSSSAAGHQVTGPRSQVANRWQH